MSYTNISMYQYINKIINDAKTYIQNSVATRTMSVENANAISDIITKLLNVIVILSMADMDFTAHQASSLLTTSNSTATSSATNDVVNSNA